VAPGWYTFFLFSTPLFPKRTFDGADAYLGRAGGIDGLKEESGLPGLRSPTLTS